jgi:hypothetical protein
MCSRKPTNPNSLTTKEITILWKNLKPPPLGKINNYKNRCIKKSLENRGIQMSSDFYETQPTTTQKETRTSTAEMSGMQLRLE